MCPNHSNEYIFRHTFVKFPTQENPPSFESLKIKRSFSCFVMVPFSTWMLLPVNVFANQNLPCLGPIFRLSRNELLWGIVHLLTLTIDDVLQIDSAPIWRNYKRWHIIIWQCTRLTFLPVITYYEIIILLQLILIIIWQCTHLPCLHAMTYYDLTAHHFDPYTIKKDKTHR